MTRAPESGELPAIAGSSALTVFELLTFPSDETEGTASLQIFKRLSPAARGRLRFYLMDLVQHLLIPSIPEGIPGARALISNPAAAISDLLAHGLVQARPIKPEQMRYRSSESSDTWFTLTEVGRRVGRLTTTGQYMPEYLVALGLREMLIEDVRDKGKPKPS